jgi:phosphopantetheinyl transferase
MLRSYCLTDSKASPELDVPLKFNISHDNGLIVMAFTSEREVGVDVMKVSTLAQFASIAESVCGQVWLSSCSNTLL